MGRLSFITTCMGRLNNLKITLPLALQPDCEYVLVDWSCPDKSGEWVKLNYPQAVVVSVPGKQYFNIAGARNAGAKAATSDRLCFIDADMKMLPGFVNAVLDKLKPDCWAQTDNFCYGFAGTIVCWKGDWKRIGGFDEGIDCWGYEDVDFKQRLNKAGLKEVRCSSRFLEHITHSDVMRVKHYKEKDLDVSVNKSLRRIAMKRLGKIPSPVYSN